MAWWLPDEFWTALFDQDPDTAERAISLVSPYTVFLVVDGKPGLIIKYRSKKDILGLIQLKDVDGNICLPLAEREVDRRAVNLIDGVQDIFARRMRRFGRDMQYVFFTGKNKAGGRLCDPTGDGSFSIILDRLEFNWKLPLPALAGAGG